MGLPVVRLAGSAYEQGLEHGRALRERIARNVEVYFDRFQREVKLSREEVLQRAGQYAEAIARQNPVYAEGMRGIAEGGGFPLLEIVALNVRYEILYFQWSREAQEATIPDTVADGCTAFAVLPSHSADGHLLLGQNWDWIPQVEGAVLHTTHEDGLRTLAFTEAGIFGAKIGFNSEGLGLCINGLLSTGDDWTELRKPFHVRCYEILRSRDLPSAANVVVGDLRSCSANFLLAQTPARVLDIESAPRDVALLQCSDGCLTHANHFVNPAALEIVEPPLERREFSYHRHARLRELLLSRMPVGVPQIQEYLRNHEEFPNALCRHPDTNLPEEERTITVSSVIMDLDERRMWVTERQPCQSDYQEVAL